MAKDDNLRPNLPLDGQELERWSRFASRGGIGKAVAARDREAKRPEELMFLAGDEVILLLLWQSDVYLAWCEGVIGLARLGELRVLTPIKKATLTRRKSEKTLSEQQEQTTPKAKSQKVFDNDHRSYTLDSSTKLQQLVHSGEQPQSDPHRRIRAESTTSAPPDSPNTSLLDLYENISNASSNAYDDRDQVLPPARTPKTNAHPQPRGPSPEQVIEDQKKQHSAPREHHRNQSSSSSSSSLNLASGSAPTSLRRQQQQTNPQTDGPSLHPAFELLPQSSTERERVTSTRDSMSFGLASSVGQVTPKGKDADSLRSPSLRAVTPSYSPSKSPASQLTSMSAVLSSPLQHRVRDSRSTANSVATSNTENDTQSVTSSIPHSLQFSPTPPSRVHQQPATRTTTPAAPPPVVETEPSVFLTTNNPPGVSKQDEMPVPRPDHDLRLLLQSNAAAVDVLGAVPPREPQPRMPRGAVAEAEAVRLHREKEVIWIQLFRKYSSARTAPKSKMLRNCKAGIPSSVRFKAWTFLTGAEVDVNQVHHLVSLPDSSPEESLRIDRDLAMLYTQHPLFKSNSAASKRDLVLVMHGLSQLQPGQYRPNLVFLANGLLQFSTAEQAFCLCSVVGERWPLLYGPFSKATSLIYIVQELLRKHDTRLLQRFQEDEGGVAQLISLWLGPLFLSGVLPTESALRVLDVALYKGEKFLFAVMLALLDLMRGILLDKSVPLRCHLQRPPDRVTDPNTLLNAAFNVKIKSSTVEKLTRRSLQHVVK